MNKCIVVSDSFKGTLSSLEICAIAREAAGRACPACELVCIPVADGGEGTVDCFLQALEGRRVVCEATGPWGEPVRAAYCRAGDRAVIEMAAAAGLPLAGERLNPERTTTFGVGQLIRHAVERGCREVLLGLGGSCTNDGGCGCAAALGAAFYRADGSAFVPVGADLDQICRIDLTDCRRRLEGVTVTAMCDVDSPLWGPGGAARVFAPQKGADPAMVERLDRRLRCFDEILRRELGSDAGRMPGGGAAGGMGAGCAALLGARLRPGIEAVLDMVDFDRLLEGADLVVTGEGRADGQSARGKVVSGVARRAGPRGVPLAVIAGSAAPEADALYELGVTALFVTDREGVGFPRCADRAGENYRRTLEDVLRLAEAMGRR